MELFPCDSTAFSFLYIVIFWPLLVFYHTLHYLIVSYYWCFMYSIQSVTGPRTRRSRINVKIWVLMQWLSDLCRFISVAVNGCRH